MTQNPPAEDLANIGSNVQIWVYEAPDSGEEGEGESSEDVTLPDISGFSAAGAEAVLEALGLVVEVDYVENSVPELTDLVFAQIPAAGTVVSAGSNVEIWAYEAPGATEGEGEAPVEGEGETPAEGEGEAPLDVPSYAGMPEAEAVAAIVDYGLTVGTIAREYSAAAVGTVIGQDPAVGTSVPAGTAVNLVVSDGPAPVLVMIPDDLLGIWWEDAIPPLLQLPVAPRSIYEETGIMAPGLVLRLENSAGETLLAGDLVEKNSEVVIVVAIAPGTMPDK